MKSNYTRDEVSRLAETIFEITSGLSAAFWDTLSDRDDRASAADEILTLAEATEEVARIEGVVWGGTHDYYVYTEALTRLLEEHVFDDTPGHLLAVRGSARNFAKTALDAAKEG